MKQKSQNRFLAALLAVAMMFQMLPLMAFADEGPSSTEGTPAPVTNERTGKEYDSLRKALEEAKDNDTIQLGAGTYFMYDKDHTHTVKNFKVDKIDGKHLTLKGSGIGVTTWQMHLSVDHYYFSYDNCFAGADTITFKNMTLEAQRETGNPYADYRGFGGIAHTVVENCEVNGKTAFWGEETAEFIYTTFNAATRNGSESDYSLWTYITKEWTFDNCTFNAKGKVINVYTDAECATHDTTINFNNCTVHSNDSKYPALIIDDRNMGSHKYIVNITNPQVKATRDAKTCSQVFGYKENWHSTVTMDGVCVWDNGQRKTHDYTDGEKDQAYDITRSAWRQWDERNDERDVNRKCQYCGWEENYTERASVYRLQYNLNGGTGAEGANYDDAFYHEKESVALAAAPTREGYQFAGWLSLSGKLYKAESELVLTGDEVFTAYWKKDEPVVNHTLTVTGGTFAVKNGDIDVTDTLETSTDEASGKQTCLVPDDAEVTVTLDQTKVPEGMVFDLWSTGKFDLPLGQDYKAESITFTMNDDVDVAAQYRSADIEDGSDVVGPIIVGTAVVAGGALVGYTLGTDLVGKMWGLPYFPSNRSALAMMLWEDAGKPMPESEILYPDVGQEEQDMDLQHAARWSMEHDLLPDLNDQDAELPPEQVKFYPDNMVTKISVLRAWKKAQDLKQNAQ